MAKELKVSEEPNKETKEARTQDLLDQWQKCNEFMNSIFNTISQNRDNWTIEADCLIRDSLRKTYRTLYYVRSDIWRAMEEGDTSKVKPTFKTVYRKEHFIVKTNGNCYVFFKNDLQSWDIDKPDSIEFCFKDGRIVRFMKQDIDYCKLVKGVNDSDER